MNLIQTGISQCSTDAITHTNIATKHARFNARPLIRTISPFSVAIPKKPGSTFAHLSTVKAATLTPL